MFFTIDWGFKRPAIWRWLLLGFVIGLSAENQAQTLPLLDQNPASLSWFQVQTPHFQVIYPAGFDSVARHTAHRLEGLYVPVSASLGKRPRPIAIVLQNLNTASNGFVTLSPRRSEFMAVTPQDPNLLGTLDWLDMLSVHEFRHVVQNDKALQGYGRVLQTLMGSSGLYVPLLTVPDWFAEGDAVTTETLLTQSGRGRIPDFDLGLRANLLAGRTYSYPKAVCGSFRDNVPNHYVLGFHLTSYLKRQFGPGVWDTVLTRNYSRFPWPFAFSASLKNVTGLTVEQLYARAMTALRDSLTRRQTPTMPYTWFSKSQQPPTKKNPVFTNYQYAQFLTDTTVLCVKSGLGFTPRLVRLYASGREEQLHVLGFLNDPALLSAVGQKAVWIEYGYDPRWGQRVYSNIRVLDLNTRKLTRLTHRARILSVALSPDQQKLIAVTQTPTYRHQLLVLETATGRITQPLPNPDGAVFQHPRWQADGRHVVVVWLKNGQKTIQQIDTKTGQTRNLLPLANENISQPQPVGPYVLFNSPRNGTDDVYAVDTLSGRPFRLTAQPLAAAHPAVSPSGHRLAFDSFQASGWRIATTPFRPDAWLPAESTAAVDSAADTKPQTPTLPIRLLGDLPQREPGAAQARQLLAAPAVSDSGFKPKPYSRLAHALNVYNWGPMLTSSGQGLTIGLSSQDILSTTQLSAGYQYNQAERVGNWFAALSYQGWYPVLDVQVEHGNRQTAIFVDKKLPADSLRSDTWQYNQVSGGVRLPLQLTQGRFVQNLNLSAYYNFLQVSGYDLPVRYVSEVGKNGQLQTLTYGLSYARLLRQSKRDVWPRSGQTLLVSYRHTPFNDRLQGEQLGIQASVYLPGIGRHHAWRVRAGYQQQASGNYRFNPAISYPRGLPYISDTKLQTASLDYRFPIANMDLALGRWLYVQRLKANLFADAAIVRQQQYHTVGFDLSVVFNVLRVATPLEAGIRSIYSPQTRSWQFQPLVIDIGF